MPPGTEQRYLYHNPVKRAIVGVVGDTHYGRVLRYLYLKQALAELRLNPRQILDAGCGRGELAMYLARRYPQAQVLAIDVSAPDLARAEEVRRAAHVTNVNFRAHDLAEPLVQDSFDLTVSWEVIQCVPDDRLMLQNVYAHSIFEQGRKLPTPIYLGMYPWLVLMGYLDVRTRREWGGGVLAIGYKRHSAS